MRKWIIAFGAISDAFLLSVSSFFFGLGAWIRINGALIGSFKKAFKEK